MSEPIHKYYLDNKALSLACGTHLVHKAGCPVLPDERRLYVGHFPGSGDALVLAGKIYRRVELCPTCTGPAALKITPEVELIADRRVICVICGRNHNIKESEQQFIQVVALSRKHGVDRILLDYTQAVSMPSDGELCSMAARLPKRWRMAGVAPDNSAILDKVKYAEELTARNGLEVKVCPDMETALAWLLS